MERILSAVSQGVVEVLTIGKNRRCDLPRRKESLSSIKVKRSDDTVAFTLTVLG